MKKLLVWGSLALAVAGQAVADEIFKENVHPVTPLAISLASPLQLPGPDWRVWGLRFDGFYGRSKELYGLDAGIVARTDGDFWGIGVSGFNSVNDNMSGIHAGVVANVVHGDVAGVQLGGVLNRDLGAVAGVQGALINYDGVLYGVQFGLLDWNNGISYGWQTAVANVNVNEFTGASFGLVNMTNRMGGFQLGLVNLVDEEGSGLQVGLFNGAVKFEGVQIGLLNVIQTSELPIMALVNANF